MMRLTWVKTAEAAKALHLWNAGPPPVWSADPRIVQAIRDAVRATMNAAEHSSRRRARTRAVRFRERFRDQRDWWM